MKSMDQHIHEIAARFSAEIPIIDGYRNPESIARWILYQYKPPVEWEEIPPDDRAEEVSGRFNWRIRVRTIIAGKYIGFQGFETDEQRSRDPNLKARHREHIRRRLGAAIGEFLDEDCP